MSGGKAAALSAASCPMVPSSRASQLPPRHRARRASASSAVSFARVMKRAASAIASDSCSRRNTNERRLRKGAGSQRLIVRRVGNGTIVFRRDQKTSRASACIFPIRHGAHPPACTPSPRDSHHGCGAKSSPRAVLL